MPKQPNFGCVPGENSIWRQRPFRAKILSCAFRLKWYVTRRCWAHNDTCTHCTKHGFCTMKRPGLLRIEGIWCCSSYDWDFVKAFNKHAAGKKITVEVERHEKGDYNEHI